MDDIHQPVGCIYYVSDSLAGRIDAITPLLDQAKDLGFAAVLLPPIFKTDLAGNLFFPADHDSAIAAVKAISEACRARGLRLYSDLALDRFAADHPLVVANPQAFTAEGSAAATALDPRRPHPPADEVKARLWDDAGARLIGDWAREKIEAWSAAGVDGFRLLHAAAAAPAFWRALIAQARATRPDLVFIAQTRGEPRPSSLALAGCGFDALTSSLDGWDGRSRRFVEDYEALRAIAPLILEVEAPVGPRLAGGGADGDAVRAAHRQRLTLAASLGAVILAPMGLDTASDGGEAVTGRADLREAVRAANALSRTLSDYDGEMRVLTGQASAVTALLKAKGPDVRQAQAAVLVLINLDPSGPQAVNSAALSEAAEFAPFGRVDGAASPLAPLQPGEVRLLSGQRLAPIRLAKGDDAVAANDASQGARLVIESVSPQVSGGDFPVKRIIGDTVSVEADVFADGHEQLAVEVRWRALDGEWKAASMTPTVNDRWSGAFTLDRLGSHEFVVEAWLDVFGGLSRDLDKKRDAGVATPVDVQEGRALIDKAMARTKGPLRKALGDQLARIDAAPEAQRLALLLQPDLAALMQSADDRPFRLQSPRQRIDAERPGAGFASWYELFPRSQTDDPARHGTFDDVIARLPAVRAMGFDVLYFPPIHPIGRTNRKGRNNSLTPAADDPGSPYAIGGEAGGHDAIHPELGTLDDFRRLVAAAAQQGLELALDFAVQCSPDHPWLKEHPGWFDHRPDGSIKYAENPPKRYEDIVNVDFYKPEATPALWLALRDIVLFWAREGVRLFRVDNPHTKPLPFWEWMIADVRAKHPDVVFLAEAFTRPKVMHRLAKIGFSQSYTYFTWRHSKSELTDYMVELTTTAPKDFFRPRFFVNTPDINPYFLQHSGRGGFLIRAALAATLSGLWGVYSGFELLEADPVPGKEEYQDSEKYQIRVRDWTGPNIIPEITRLNMIRKGHPALHSHLGVTFLPAFNDNVLFFEKASPAGDDVLLIAISLDPHNVQEADLELPLWRWGLPDDASVEVEDLVFETRFTLHGKHQHVRLDPDHPYAIWSILTPRSPAP